MIISESALLSAH